MAQRSARQDGAIGHVEDIEVDPQSWAIADLVVDTRDWLPGSQVRIAPGAIEHIDAQAREVSVAMRRDEIERAPPAE